MGLGGLLNMEPVISFVRVIEKVTHPILKGDGLDFYYLNTQFIKQDFITFLGVINYFVIR